MNSVDLALSATVLEACFNEAADLSSQVAGLYGDLKPYLEKAQKGKVNAPIAKSRIPGAYLFSEGELREYPDLERAYVHFRMQISGGLSRKQKAVLDNMRKT